MNLMHTINKVIKGLEAKGHVYCVSTSQYVNAESRKCNRYTLSKVTSFIDDDG